MIQFDWRICFKWVVPTDSFCLVSFAIPNTKLGFVCLVTCLRILPWDSSPCFTTIWEKMFGSLFPSASNSYANPRLWVLVRLFAPMYPINVSRWNDPLIRSPLIVPNFCYQDIQVAYFSKKHISDGVIPNVVQELWYSILIIPWSYLRLALFA